MYGRIGCIMFISEFGSNRQKEIVYYKHHRRMEETFSDLKQMFEDTARAKRDTMATAMIGWMPPLIQSVQEIQRTYKRIRNIVAKQQNQ